MSERRRHESTRRPATDEEARALASTVRLRILRICLGEPRTNREIADALGRDAGSVLHHVRTLADTGFLEALEPRRGTRGAREIPYLATGKSWQIDTPGAGLLLLDTFVEEVGLVPVESVNTMRMGFRFTEADRVDFDNRLRELVEEFMHRTDDSPDGEPWSLFVALHPDPNRPPGTTPT